MVNAVYRAAMTELETILSPRIVSRSLNAGLKQVGKSPKDVEYRDMEKIFKSHIYKQLQVAMQPEKAKDKISAILDRLENINDSTSGPPPFLEQQSKTIAELNKVFKIFNIYFEWPEVQKARSLLKLIEKDHAAQKETTQLIADARVQLKKAEEKLNDKIVQQAAEIQRLEEAYEAVRNIEGTKVRRLGRLIGQVKNAQSSKQLASAELERARKLISGLLEEIDQKEQIEKNPTEIDYKADSKFEKENVDLLADINNEVYELDSLSKNFANLLAFKPELIAKINASKQKLSLKETPDILAVDLSKEFAETQKQLCTELKTELVNLQKEVLAADEKLDKKQLKQNLQVTLDVLGTTLPAEADVREIHDLYRLFKQRAAELIEKGEKERQVFEVKLQRQKEALEQLNGFFERNGHSLSKKDYNSFAEKLELLTKAQQNQELAEELLAESRQVAENIELVIAKQTFNESTHQKVHLEVLLTQVQAIPIIEPTKRQAKDITAELKQSLERFDSKELKPKRIKHLEKTISKLKDATQLNYQSQLLTFKKRAENLDSKDCINLVSAAQEKLKNNEYPDLNELEQTLKEAFDKRLADELEDLHQLEAERNLLSKAQDKAAKKEIKELDKLLKEIRNQLEKGKLAIGIDRCWSLLESLRDQEQQILISFEPRLDTALKDFVTVSKLHNDTTTNVSRTLRHLDGQRQTFSKVSAEMRGKLESSLHEAEDAIRTLKEELEAASAVAGKLMSGNILDDIFGKSDSITTAKDTVEEAAVATPVSVKPLHSTTIRSSNELLNEWLDDYLKNAGVRDAVIFTSSGELLAGCTLLEPSEVFSAIQNITRDWQVFGEELTLGQQQMFTIELSQLTLINAYPKEGYNTTIILDNPSTLNDVLSKMRLELPIIKEILSGPAFA